MPKAPRRNLSKRLASASVLDERLKRVFKTLGSSFIRYVRIEGRFRTNRPVCVDIPRGTKNLQVRFVRGSILECIGIIGVPTTSIRIGGDDVAPTTSGFNVLQQVVAGDQLVVVPYSSGNPGNVPTIGKWYFLYDQNKQETHADNSSTRKVGGELVRVNNVVPNGGAGTADVYLDQVISQPYGEVAGLGTLLSDLPTTPEVVDVCENISILGPTLVGKTVDGNYDGWIFASYCAGLTIRFVNGRLADDKGISLNRCRNIVCEHVWGSDVNTLTGGSRYTFQFVRCADVIVNRAFAQNTRYTVVMEAGTSQFRVNGAFGYNIIESVFDIHGGDAYDGTVFNAVAQPGGANWGSIALGNTAWRRGARNVTLTNGFCNFLNLRTGIRDSSVIGVVAKRVNLYTRANPPAGDVGAPAPYPQNLTLDACTVNYDAGSGATDGAIHSPKVPGTTPGTDDKNAFVGIVVKNSTIQCTTGFVPAFKTDATTVASDITFENSTLVANSGTSTIRALSLVSTAVASSNVKATLKTGCIVKINTTQPYVGSSSATSGTITIENDLSGVDNVRQPDPGPPPGGPTSTRVLQSGDFTGVTYVQI